MDINTIASYIIAVGGVVLAIERIYGFVVKPKKAYDKYLDKNKEEILQLVQTTLKEDILAFLEEDKTNFDNNIKTAQDELEYHTLIVKTILASLIESVYWNGVDKEEVTAFEQEAVNKWYELYHRLGGNGHIGHLVTKMHSWSVVSNNRSKI